MAAREYIPVRDGYDRWSAVYDTDGNPLFVLEGPLVREWLGDVSGRVIVDVGCGTGRHTAWLGEAGARVVALDFSEGMMRRARAKVGRGSVWFCRYRIGEGLPLADGCCDGVLFSLVADHIEGLGAVFVEFARVLKPGGSVVFMVLHPAMNLAGVTARFCDPDSGEPVYVAAFEHSFGDYVMAVLGAGLEVTEIVERVANEETAKVSARAAKYLGWPMLLAIRARKR